MCFVDERKNRKKNVESDKGKGAGPSNCQCAHVLGIFLYPNVNVREGLSNRRHFIKGPRLRT